MMLTRCIPALTLTLAFLAGNSIAAADAARGANAFGRCAACHSTAPGVHMTGPSLADVWGRKAGTAAGFVRYSDALKASGITWNEQTLDKWLTNPASLVPGNNMTFPGVGSARERQDIVAFLKAVSEGKAPAGARGRGAMMGGSRKLDLRKAPPEGQVSAIEHCRDTYTIKTADGKTAKVWEFNLRFKIDSSPDGPAPGNPVIVGAGMHGDRASVVFSTPAEIGRLIRESCD